MQCLFLYNPAAGRLPARLFVYDAVRVLRQAGWTVRLVASKHATHVTELARRAAEDGLDVVFAAGGDGTLRMAAAGLAGSQTALGVLPAGTSNVLGADLGLASLEWTRPWAMRRNVQKLMQAAPAVVDMGLCNGQPFLLWAGIGLDGLTIRRVEPRNRAAKYVPVPHFFVEAVTQAALWNGVNVQVSAGHEHWQGQIMQAVATNIRSYLGGLAAISPEARMNDRQMDLWLFSGANLSDALRHAFGMLGGHHLRAVDAHKISFERLVIEADAPFHIQLDGDPLGETTRAEISCQPGVLKLLVPMEARGLLKPT